MYFIPSPWIAVGVWVAMTLALVLGHRVGRTRAALQTEDSRAHLAAMQGAMLSVLALLLGFTFSLALQRHDSRSEAVVTEANAIGTACLRARLLPEPVRGETLRLLSRYVDLRLRESSISLDHGADREAYLAESDRVLDALWAQALRSVELDERVVTTGLFVQALNEAIDAGTARDATLRRHVPEPISWLLFVTFAVTASVVGYTAGTSRHMPSIASHVLIALIVALTFVIVDLDRPRRGLITVDTSSLTKLRASLPAPQ